MRGPAPITIAALSLGLALLPAAGCSRGPRPPVSNDAPPAPAAPAPAPAESYDFTALDRILERASPQLGGCALVLVKDGRVIYRKAFGRFSADKVVPIASASKWLSGAVIMSLVDEGRLRLDDTVSKYLPEFAGDKAGITIRHLFSHTSGLPPEARCRNDKRTTLADCARELAQLRPRAAPGAEFHYGGVSMHVGGRVAEIAGGKPWGELFAERVAAPLGMSETDFFAYGPTRNPRPEGDARGSADDYARFLLMILNRGEFNGRRVLSGAAVAEMHRDQTIGARIGYTIYEKHAGLDPELPAARYGLGVWREKVDKESGELLEASSQGALGFSPWIDPRRNLAGVLSTQSSFSRVMPTYLALKDEVRRIVPAAGSATGLR